MKNASPVSRWFGLLVLCVAGLWLGGCGALTLTLGAPQRGLDEAVVHTEPGHRGNKIAVIDITGVIVNADRPGLLSAGENPVSLLHEKLEKAANDRSVKAIVLRLNTPGGGVTASDLMYREVRRFRERSDKPVVALGMDVMASGGYYVACGADAIVAQPTSVVGSIGVIAQTVSVKPALERWGIASEAIVSGPNKAMGSPLEHMSDEHRALLQGLVDDFYERFATLVKTRRPGITEERFAEVTDGRVVSGDRALTLGLVDQVGDIYDAAALAKSLAGIERARLVIYHRPLDYAPSPYAAAPHAPTTGTQINLAQVNLPGSALSAGGDWPVGFYYLWRPAF